MTVNVFFFLRGDGTGKYLSNTTILNGVTTWLTDLTTADFNNDGNLDVAISGGNATSSQTQIQIAWGDGTGSFNLSSAFLLPYYANSYITHADLNNDNYEDIYVHNADLWYAERDSVYLLRNNAGINFTLINTNLCATTPLQFFDYNIDGNLDLLVNKNVYLGNGNSIFNYNNQIDLDPNNFVQSGVSIFVQLNNDSILDYVTCFLYSGQTSGPNPNGFSIIPGGVNTSNAVEYKHIQTSYVVYGVRSGDFNGDGLVDIVCYYEDFGIEIFINQGNLNFISAGVISTAKPALQDNANHFFAIRDVNNDGKDDIILPGCKLGIILGSELNNYNPYIHADTYPQSIFPPCGLATADFNHDGKMDFASATYSNYLATSTNYGNGTFNFTTIPFMGANGNKVYSGDLNNDGNSDLIRTGAYDFSGTFSNTIGLYPGSSNGVFGTPILLNVDANTSVTAIDLVLGDFNNDNNIDIITQNNYGRITVFLNNGNFTFSSTLINLLTVKDIAAADFNMDGKLDLISFDNAVSTRADIFLGNGDGTFGPVTYITLPSACGRICTGDFNGDGKKDFCAASTLSGAASLKVLGNGDGTFQSPITMPNMYTQFDIYAKDLNGDNKDEIMLVKAMDQNLSGFISLKVAYVNAQGNTLYNEYFGGRNGGGIAFADINSDGKEDVLFSDGGSNQVVILYNNSVQLPISTPYTPLCNGNSIAVNLPVGQDYTWNTGSNSNPYLITGPGTYIVTSTNFSGTCSTSDTLIVNLSSDNCVWPGDANEDLIVNNIDLIPIGLKFGNTGSARSAVSNNWMGYSCGNWNDTLSNGLNIKYTDCNGNGTINFDDTLAIHLNYGQTHIARLSQPKYQTTNPDIYLLFNQTSYYQGDILTADVYLGSNSNPQNNFYGASFSIYFDNTVIVPGSESFSFNDSWVGNINQSKIKFGKIDLSQGRIDASLVRINHLDASGFGKIATLQFTLKNNLPSQMLFFSINDAVKSNALGIYNPLNNGVDSVFLNGIIGLNNIVSNDNINLYPNPANDEITIQSKLKLGDIKIYNALGSCVFQLYSEKKIEYIKLENLVSGVYIIKTYSCNKVFVIE